MPIRSHVVLDLSAALMNAGWWQQRKADSCPQLTKVGWANAIWQIFLHSFTIIANYLQPSGKRGNKVILIFLPKWQLYCSSRIQITVLRVVTHPQTSNPSRKYTPRTQPVSSLLPSFIPTGVKRATSPLVKRIDLWFWNGSD